MDLLDFVEVVYEHNGRVYNDLYGYFDISYLADTEPVEEGE